MHTAVTKRAAAMALATGLVGAAHAGIVVYEEGDKSVEIGARIQLQYRQEDPAVGQSTDSVFFRRLRPYITGTVTKNWLGKVQFDFGGANDDDEVAVKDAYLQYLGLDRHKITIGSSKAPFSREFLTSSKRQQLVERTFTGDHNYGVPDRQLGVRVDGGIENEKVTYAASLGWEQHDPDAAKLDFDSPAVNKSDWNEGVLIVGRVDFHPLGYMKFDQADFRSEEWKLTFGLSGFSWSNDDDNNTFTTAGVSTSATKADLDSADGIEISAGTRGRGFSADVAYQVVSGDTVDPAFTGGVYLNGTTELNTLSIEGGYLLPGTHLEIVAARESLDADNFADEYERTSVGLNYYINKHKTKLQVTYQMEDNVAGAQGVERDLLYGQAQFVF